MQIHFADGMVLPELGKKRNRTEKFEDVSKIHRKLNLFTKVSIAVYQGDYGSIGPKLSMQEKFGKCEDKGESLASILVWYCTR